tara:strand:- start:4676 stop:4900 length:225 start_codon:yes stop_codon:yes gene_type:complete
MFFDTCAETMAGVYRYASAFEKSGEYVETHAVFLVSELKAESKAKVSALCEALDVSEDDLFHRPTNALPAPAAK